MQKYVELKTKQGTMRGFIHLPEIESYPLVIMFHGFTAEATGDKFSYIRLSRILEKEGIGSLRMNFLGSGESDLEFNEMTFKNELECACQMVEMMDSKKEISQIYLLGHSMGGAIASELSKLYPKIIQKICLWAPALNISELFKSDKEIKEITDVWGFEVGREFIEDIVTRDFFKDLDIYQNDLLIIHGNNDQVVDYNISRRYLEGYSNCKFITVEGGSHSFDKIEDMAKVIDLTAAFFKGE